MTALRVDGHVGLGDNIYARPFVRALAKQADTVWLNTPWPELYEDIPNIRFELRHTHLRTQTKNIARQPADRWSVPPQGARIVRVKYNQREVPQIGIVRSMKRAAGIAPDLPFDLPPPFDPKAMPRRFVIVRPVTERTEWPAPARNPDPGYVATAASILRLSGHHVVSVAHVEPPHEVYIGDPPPVDKAFDRGELVFQALLSIVRNAELVVAGPGFMIPLAIAAGTPLIVIGGGCLGLNGPSATTDPIMDLSRVRWILPNPSCACNRRDHDCPKHIPNFADQFAEAVQEVTRQ